MKFIFALFLGLSSRSAAEMVSRHPPATLLSTIPDENAVFSPDFSLAAAAGARSVNVWRVLDGHQLHRIPLPTVKRMDASDYIGFRVWEISPDNRSLLLGLEHHRDWKEGEYAVYLVTLDDEKTAPLLLRRMSCRQGPFEGPRILPTICPNGFAFFSPDGNRVAVWIQGAAAGSWSPRTPYRREFELDLLDRSGKVQETHRESSVQNPPIGSVEQPVADDVPIGIASFGSVGFDRAGRLLGVIQDESGCEVRDLSTGKRTAFLDDCSRNDALTFSGHSFLYGSAKGKDAYTFGTIKRWEIETGRLDFKRTTDDLGDYTDVQNDGRIFHFDAANHSVRGYARGDIEPHAFAAFDVPAGTVGPLAASADGALVSIVNNGRRDVYKTGLGSSSQPPAMAPEIDLPDVDAPPATDAKMDPDAFAVVIGVEKYRQPGIPSVDFAARDARSIYSYLTNAMGFDARNVVLLVDSGASKTDLEKNIGSWLRNRVGPQSRVFVYYAGHGSPNPETGQGYLMPYEADPAYLEDTAYPLSKLYASLGSLPTGDVTVVLDACFSGQGGRSLIAKGTRPLVNMVQARSEPNTTVLAATGPNQVSASLPAARHGLLTYYLLAGLHGAADAKHDGRITSAELFDYVRPAVERAAKRQNVAQTPMLASPAGAVERPWIVLAPKP